MNCPATPPPRSAEERSAAGERLDRFRVVTEIAQDDRGWWVEILFWWNERAVSLTRPMRPEDDGFRVGPWPSRQVARREMRGGVRKLTVDAVQDFAKRYGGKFERFEVGP